MSANTPTGKKTGTLYLVPAPLDFGCDAPLPPVTDVLPQATLQHMARLGHWVCENARTLRALLKRVHEVQALAQPLQPAAPFSPLQPVCFFLRASLSAFLSAADSACPR